MQNSPTELTRAAELEVPRIFEDWSWFAERLGSTARLKSLSAAGAVAPVAPVQDALSLERFVEFYRDHVLISWELPSIFRAFHHAEHSQFRELVLLDQHLAAEPVWEPFREASRKVGRLQLEQLRPLRDHRGVQRYGKAVDSGQASAWHTVVYGLMLAIYSLPLRQGLWQYAQRTVHGLITAASKPLRLPLSVRQRLNRRLMDPVPEIVEQMLKKEGPLRPLVIEPRPRRAK